MTLMAFAEVRRLQDYRKPGSQNGQFFLGLEAVFGGSGTPAYPGGQFFNMAGLGSKSAEEMKKLKVNEVKNGRLAMIAMLGYFVQAAVTHEGPYENLCAHLANPTGANILTNFGKIGGAF
jgi:light-harvesting complex I chlorophyll a/b binding protein 3